MAAAALGYLVQRQGAAEGAELNWSGWLFWSVLILAVLVLIGFAVRLYRQMNEQ